MALPTSRNTTYAPGTQLKSADLNDIQDKIIHLAGDGQMDFPLSVNAGLDVPSGESIRLEASPRTQLYFEGEEQIVIPFCAVIWSPTDDGDMLLDGSGGASGGRAEFAGVARFMVPIMLPRNMFITSITILYRRDPSNTFTAVFRGRNPIGAVITDHATGTTGTGAASDQFLVLTPGSPVEIEDGFEYWLSMLSDGAGPCFYSATVKYTHPAP